MAKTNEDQIKELQAQIAQLSKELDSESHKRGEAEESARKLSAGSLLVGNADDGVSTGKTVTTLKCKNPWEQNQKKQEFYEVEVPTFMYTINIPSGSGLSLSTNGIEYYHGQTYEVDLDTLRDLRSRSEKCWKHEKAIHGDNENAYRKQANTHIRFA
jgi:hypothetical protein